MKNFYKSMIATAEQCGLKILSDDFCCKLLAWVYVYGGENEDVVFGRKIYTDIQEAQKRLNISGGETPNVVFVPKMKTYIKELEGKNADWITEIEGRYNIKSRE